MSEAEAVFEVDKRKTGDGWSIVAPFLDNEGNLQETRLALPGCTQHEAKRIAKALNNAYELGKTTAVRRIARGLAMNKKAIQSLAV